MKLRINSCGISDCPPSWHWITAKDGFPAYDLWATFRGKGTIGPASDPETVFRVHESTVILLTPNTQFKAEHEPEHPIFNIHVHFDFLDDENNIIHPRQLTAKTMPDVALMRSLLMRVVTLFHGNKKEDACTYLAAALAEFDLSEPLADCETEHLWTQIIYEISGEIDAGGPIPTLAEYAERYAYSERYIGKMFHQIRGISFSEYSRNVRIEKAKTLLRHTDAPIAVIAEETGFYDACHFTKTFRSAVGMSPLAYRRNR